MRQGNGRSQSSLMPIRWPLFGWVIGSTLILSAVLAGIRWVMADTALPWSAIWALIGEEALRLIPAAVVVWTVVTWRLSAAPISHFSRQHGAVRNPVANLARQLRHSTAGLRLSEEKSLGWCQQLFEDCAEPILVIDPGSELVLDANPAAVKLMIKPRDQLVGVAVARLCPAATPVLRRFMQRVQRDRSAWVTALHCQNTLGEPLSLEVKASLVARADGDVILATIRDLVDKPQRNARLADLAYHDALTGLPNLVLLRDRLQMALARCQAKQARGALLMLDVDNFKTINDSLSHSSGDRLLQALAERLRKGLHPEDTLARWGGDEFVVLPREHAERTAQVLEHALAIVDQLRSALERPFDLDGHEIHVTLSVGVAVFPNDGDTVDELLRRVDSAMFQAKATGRNTTHFYSPELEEKVALRLTLGAALRRALVEEQFVLHFQPKYSFTGNVLVGCEALVRWERPGHGCVAPMAFLPYLDEMGLLTELGFWVLDKACQSWREGRDCQRLDSHFRMAVNLSAGQFASPAFVQMVLSVLQENDMPGSNLELEITEQALVNDLPNAAKKINALQAHGVTFAIDDFGTGYSSLAYLQQLPVDCLKIDRGFVQQIGQENRGADLVDIILSIARKLNLRVVVEGVEARSQADYLATKGCDVGQGYLLGRPMPWERLLTRVGAQRAASITRHGGRYPLG